MLLITSTHGELLRTMEILGLNTRTGPPPPMKDDAPIWIFKWIFCLYLPLYHNMGQEVHLDLPALRTLS